jgi:hypothetical protein
LTVFECAGQEEIGAANIFGLDCDICTRMATPGGNIYVYSGREINLYKTQKFSSFCAEERESVFDIVAITDCVLDKGGIVIQFSGRARNFLRPNGLGQLWDSFIPHLDGYWPIVRRVQSGRNIHLTYHLQLIARLRINATQTPFTHPPS